MNGKLDCTSIILAGGKSIRLGYDKAFAILDNRTLIKRTIDCLSQISQTILIVTNQDQLDSYKAAGLKGNILVDLYAGGGTLGGIYTGLANSATHYNFIVGCDMPFLNIDLVRYLLDLAPGFDAVVPKMDDKIEPLHAIYSRNCIPYIELLQYEEKLRVSQIFSLVNTRYVAKNEITRYDPQHMSFFNLNTKGDLIRAKTLNSQRVI
jgi:molybdenum cofactor guanylyltransferase